MIVLKGLEDKAEYRDGNLVCKNVSLSSLFYSNDFRYNIDLEDGCFQFGWDSLCIFEEEDTGFRLMKQICYKHNVDIPDIKHFTQVVTRAVETCTFAHITVGNIHILAHLDDNQLERGYYDIAAEVTAAKIKCNENGVIGFCSRINCEDEAKFSKDLKDLCKKEYNELIRHPGDKSNWPTDEKTLNSKLLGHLEIGLCRENGNVILFGDITDISDIDNKTMSKPSRHFIGQEQLFAVKETLKTCHR
ncbi:MAG: hypothetical protein J1G01_01425 [Clostridiales bacterium]|nr:hypothetical protein [Clostridiales bacterium]